jgi:hypothetical protein
MRSLAEVNYTLSQGSAFDLRAPAGSVDLLVNKYMFGLIPYENYRLSAKTIGGCRRVQLASSWRANLIDHHTHSKAPPP